MTSYRLSDHETVTVVTATTACLHVEASYAPGGKPPPMHRHPAQTERFRIRSGSLRIVVEGNTRDLGPGDELTVPPNTPHQMSNVGTERAEVDWFTEPAGRTEHWFALVSRRNPLLLAVGLIRYRDVFRLSRPTRRR